MENEFFSLAGVLQAILVFVFSLFSDLMTIGVLTGFCWYVYTHKVKKQPVTFVAYAITTTVIFRVMREIYIAMDGYEMPLGYWPTYVLLLALSFPMTKPVIHGCIILRKQLKF